jgi:tetratricopeptide (TPR) repeat protein
VSKLFIKAAREHHPDQVPASATAEERSLRSSIFSLLNEAHQTLSDKKRREEYLAALQAGYADAEVDVAPILQSEHLFQQGEILLRNRKYQEAVQAFQEAVELQPEEGEFQIYLAYARFCASGGSDKTGTRRLIEQILKGLKLRENRVAAGYLFLGRIHKSLDDFENAIMMFRQVLRLEQNNVEAQREIRLLEKRNPKKGKSRKR